MMLRSLSTREGLRNSSSEPCAATHEFISSCRNSPKSGGKPSCDRQSLVAHRNQQIKRGFSSNIFVLVPVIFTVSLFFGTVFYRLHHGWELSTAFYFSAQVLAGCMYDMPPETDAVSTSFSLVFFLFGSSAMAGAFGAFVSTLVSNSSQIASDTRKIIRSGPAELTKSSSFKRNTQYAELVMDASWRTSCVASYCASFRSLIGWDGHRSKYITVVAALLWYSIGVSYGTVYERWPIMKACRFALGAMAASGVPAPVCLRVEGQSDCQLGSVRGLFVGIYVIVGVPLFAFTLGQFAGMIVERAIREREMQIMSRPLGESEFRFALKLKKPSKATATSARSDNLAEEVGRKSANMPMSAEGFRPPYQQRPTPLSDQMGIPSASCRRCSINIPKGVRPRAYSESCINTTSSNRDTALPAQSNDEPAFSEFTIDFGEFVVLEMLRLRRVDEHDLDAIRDLFDDIDNDNSGTINEEKLTSYNQLLQGQNFELDEEVRGNLRPVSVSDSYAVAQRAPSRSCNEFDGGDGDSEPLIAADPSLRRSSSSCLLTIPEVSNVPVSSERKSELLSSSPPCRLSDYSLNDEKQIFLPKERDAPHASSFHMGQATTLDGRGKGHQLNDNNIDGLISKAQCLASSSAMIDDAEVQSENSTSTKGAGQNIRQSIAEDYNRLLLPILHMRHHGPSSGLRKSRQPESWFGTGNTSPDESFAVRRQSVDADALADSDSEDDCSGDKGTYGGRKGSDIRFKREMVPGEIKEARETSGMWSISHLRDARNERFALSSKEEHHRASLFDSDLEHGHSSSFSKIAGFPGYGAMQTIKEENG